MSQLNAVSLCMYLLFQESKNKSDEMNHIGSATLYYLNVLPVCWVFCKNLELVEWVNTEKDAVTSVIHPFLHSERN